ncbi:MAG: hypothetical protein WC314_21400 [Vulcanimicrobiota bacterium]
MKRDGGYTLVEILVAGVMALVVLAALLRVFWFARTAERSARSSYLIRQDADELFRRLQDDLRLTHLASIKVASYGRGFSMASPLQDANPATFEVTQYGVAKWKTWVHYTTLPTGAFVGDAVRWELPVPEMNLDPTPSTHPPDQPNASKKVMIKGVMLPGVGTIAPKAPTERITVGVKPEEEQGGLRLSFVRREGEKETLSTINPTDRSDGDHSGWSKGSTGLVECCLSIADESKESGYWSVFQIKFRVAPRN